MPKTYTPPAISAQAQRVLHDLLRAAEIAVAGRDERTATMLSRIAIASSNTMERRAVCTAVAADAATAEVMTWTPVVEAAHAVALDVIARTGALANEGVLPMSPVARAMLDAYHRTAPGGC